MANFTIITGYKGDHKVIRDGFDMTVEEVYNRSAELEKLGYQDIWADTGEPVRCPECDCIVRVDKQGGVQELCAHCKHEKNKAKLAKAYK